MRGEEGKGSVLHESDKKKVESIGLSLYKRFGYPQIKEIGIELNADGNTLESVGEIYEIGEFWKGKSVVIFSKQDIQKLHRANVGAVEVAITEDNKLLVINHYLHEEQE